MSSAALLLWPSPSLTSLPRGPRCSSRGLRVGGFSSAPPSANVYPCFARQHNSQLTAPVWVILKGSGWNLSPAGSLEVSISAVVRDNNTHALRPPAPAKGCTSAVAALEIQLVLNVPKTVFKISKTEYSTVQLC